MNLELLISSIRNREPIWNQQMNDHHNRFTLDKLWKEVGIENNCPVKDAQSKWKSLRDYYRKEVRKMQEERSGSGAESLYKSNWPYFLMLDFLRSQFKTRPTSGNIKKKCENLEEQTTDTNFEEANLEDNANDISVNYPSESQVTEGGNDVGNVSTSASVRPSSANEKTMNEGLVHQNNFNKRRAQNPELKKLIQIEEKKMALLEEKRARREEKPNDDMMFFESLLPHMKNINGAEKLLFRNDVTNLVLKYAYSHDSSRPSTATSIYQSFVPSDHSLQNSTSPTPQQDNSLLDLDQWNQSFNP